MIPCWARRNVVVRRRGWAARLKGGRETAWSTAFGGGAVAAVDGSGTGFRGLRLWNRSPCCSGATNRSAGRLKRHLAG
jgi:hypothetical protein